MSKVLVYDRNGKPVHSGDIVECDRSAILRGYKVLKGYSDLPACTGVALDVTCEGTVLHVLWCDRVLEVDIFRAAPRMPRRDPDITLIAGSR